MRKVLQAAALAAIMLQSAALSSARGADNTWTNAAGNLQWNTTSANWTSPAVWNNANSDVAIFNSSAGATISLTSAITVRGIRFQVNNITLSGGSILTLSGGGSGSLGAGEIEVVSGMTATISAQIAGTVGLTKLGAGTLILSNSSNSYTGDTTLAAGILSVDANSQLGNVAGQLVFNGGALQITGTSFTSTARTISWGAGGGGFDIANATNTFTVSQAIGAGGSLTKLGAGTLVLSNAANAYTGGTILNAGTLSVSADGNLGNAAGGLSFNGGTLQITGTTFTSTARTITWFPAGGTFDINSAANVFTLSQALGTGGSLIKSGAGTLVLSNTANGYIGTTRLNAGTLSVSANGNLGNAITSLTFDGGTLRITGTTFTSTARTIVWGAGGGGFDINNAANTFTVGQTLGAGGALTKSGAGILVLSSASNAYTGGTTISAGTLRFGATTALSSGPVAVNAGTLDLNGISPTIGSLSGTGGTVSLGNQTLTINQSADATYSGTITGTGGTFNKSGSSVLTLANTNTYSGGTTFTAGTLSVNADAQLGNAAGGLSFNGGLMQITGTTFTSTPRTITWGVAGGGFDIANAANTFTVSQALSAGGALTKSGPGALVLSNAGTSYTGSTTINAGTLRLGAANILPTTGTVTVHSATLDLNGFDQTIGALTFGSGLTANPQVTTGAGTLTLGSFSGNITVVGGAGTLPVSITGKLDMGPVQSRNIAINNTTNQAYDAVIGAVIIGTSGINLTATSPANSSLALTAANTYTGPTTIGAGKLVLGVANALPPGSTMNMFGPTAQLILNPTVSAQGVTAGNYNQSLTLLIGVAGSQVSLGSAQLTVSPSSSHTFAGDVTGTGTLRVAGNGGTLTLAGANNTANLLIDSGSRLRVDSVTGGASGFGALGSGSLTITANGILQYGGPNDVTSKIINLGNVGRIEVSTPGTTLTLTSAFVPVAGTQFQKGGSGTLVLTTANTHNSTLINGGVLEVSADAHLGTAGSNLNIALGTLRHGAAFNLQRPVIVNSGAIDTNGFAVSFSNNISGSGSFIKDGAGTLTFAPSASIYTGGTVVVGGTLLLGNAGALPVNGNVTVITGAGLDFGSNFPGPALGNMDVNGGTVLVGAGSGGERSVASLRLTGGAFSGAGAQASFLNLTSTTGLVSDSSAVTSTIVLTGALAPGILNMSTGPTAIQVAAGTTALGIDLDITTTLFSFGSNRTFEKTGAGTLRLNPGSAPNTADIVVRAGRLRIDDQFVLGTGRFALNGGTLSWGGGAVTFAKAINLDGPGTIEMLATTTLTITTPIGGPGGGLTITGPGTLVLPVGSTYGGGTTIDGATFPTTTDAVFGSGSIAVINGGTLRFTGSPATARTYNLNSGGTVEVIGGQTLTLAGARINGGFLRGSGTFTLTGLAALNGVSTSTSTSIFQTGSATVTSFSNGGAYTVNTGQVLTWNAGTNTTSGRFTLGGTANVNEFVSDGLIFMVPGAIINNSGSDMYLGGGSTTFIASPGNTIATKIDLGGKDLHLRGGLLQNNGGNFASGGGIRNGTVIVDFGGKAKGTGFYEDILTQNGGIFSPGNSPGATPLGTVRISPGGILNIDVDAAGPNGTPPLGAPGGSPGWSLVTASTALRIYATPGAQHTITLTSLLLGTNTPGNVQNFDPTKPHRWEIIQMLPGANLLNVETGGTPLNPSTFSYDPSIINISTDGFSNNLAGGSFSTSFELNGSGTYSIYVNFIPAPEPTTILGIAALGLGLLGFVRRRCTVVRAV